MYLSHRSIYKLLFSAVALSSVALGFVAVMHVTQNHVEYILKEAALACIAAAVIVYYRFFYGKQKGHILLFLFNVIVLLANFMCYVGVQGDFPLKVGFFLIWLLVIVVICLASYLRMAPSCDYFNEYFP